MAPSAHLRRAAYNIAVYEIANRNNDVTEEVAALAFLMASVQLLALLSNSQ